MAGKLENDMALNAQLVAAEADAATSKEFQEWSAELSSFLAEVKAAVPEKLQDLDFLEKLWEENPVASTGMGTIPTAPALNNKSFRDWFENEVKKPLSTDPVEVETHLTEFYNKLCSEMSVLCGRTPKLKINRVLCSLYPEHFTSLADTGALLFLHKEMGGRGGDHPVRAHKAIRAHMGTALGEVGSSNLELAQRICLPWQVFKRFSDDKASTTPISQDALQALKPLSATLRRKGLTPMGGSFQTLLALLPDLSEGVTKDEFVDLLKQVNPELGGSGLSQNINIFTHEFKLCKRDGVTYHLTARGINLLDTQNPDELADHLLTQVLGVDHILKTLQKAPETRATLIDLLKSVHSGWTTNYIPSSLIGWLNNLEVIAASDNTRPPKMRLTERGKRWADLIDWEPECMPKQVVVEVAAELRTENAEVVKLPHFSELSARINTRVASKLVFDQSLMKQLHAGLWFHPVRHFAVLTGISGSGKTQLAENYAMALCLDDEHCDDNERVKIIPVQPGWYDPSPLLGYVNPIQESSYRAAPFLDLLLRAVDDPERPYVAILDEMNLSHPEQYLAPVLSAIETHGWVDLHQLAEGAVPVPRRVKYPANLAIIGTLNMDETTHGLSDKVLDRAFTLEFWNISVQDYPGWVTVELEASLKEKTKKVLTSLVEALSPVRLHFGWRTIDDVLRYLRFHTEFSPDDPKALDNIIYAKVLPKLRGETSVKFESALKAVYACLEEHELSRCCEKVRSMQEDLAASGAARFWR